MDRSDIAQKVDAVFDTMTPDELWVTFVRAAARVTNTAYPEAIIMANVDPQNPTTVKSYNLVCPRPGCNEVDNVCLVDAAVRGNKLTPPAENDGYLDMGVHAVDGEFNTVAFECQGCGMPLDLPEFAEAIWD